MFKHPKLKRSFKAIKTQFYLYFKTNFHEIIKEITSHNSSLKLLIKSNKVNFALFITKNFIIIYKQKSWWRNNEKGKTQSDAKQAKKFARVNFWG